MSGYLYYDGTGERAIDQITSALESAGTAFHHTDQWNEECGYTPYGMRGLTPSEWIQGAANDAAAEMASLRTDLAQAKAELEQARAGAAAELALICEELDALKADNAALRAELDAALKVVDAARKQRHAMDYSGPFAFGDAVTELNDALREYDARDQKAGE